MTELKLLQCRVDGRYDIEDCLGRGSYAEIYMARDLAATDERFRKVVIKALNVLLQGYQDLDLERTLIQNFQNEAVALDRVRHPNIISRLGHGTAIDLTGTAFHYIVLEYLGGGDLSVLSRQGALRLDRALFYLQQLCAGLSHAHACGVIHRDIKPQNLLLTADHETLKIADFGVAKIEAAEGAITRVGTNIYAAPEHNPLVQTAALDTGSLLSSHTQLTPAADIYSLAKTAYTMICGVPPRAFAQHAITAFPAPVSGEPWAPSVLRVLERATQTRPTDRFQTVQDFWDEFSDASMPPTQRLNVAEARRPISSDLGLEAEVITAPPPRPRFETSRELQYQQNPGNGATRPKIVVPIAGRPSLTTTPAAMAGAQGFAAPQQLGRVTVPVAARNGEVARNSGPAIGPRPRKRSRDFVVGLILVLCFAGLLIATGAYVRKWIKTRTPMTEQTPPTGIVGRDALTTTDLNLRDGPNVGNNQIGVAEAGSKVRVLSLNNNWCEVQVIQHSRPKDEPNSADRGWVNKRFLKFD
ncbi:MAG: eukaryotic-like serine/threonine-protein kinase [Blastocatellia bacterium]|jgi:serine/threonine protein kinase|nr:eukaryotic-like serine/threonine-protein kinase [Blastocatellia bacterium]